MATTESRLKQINRRIKQIYDAFGGKSIEYNKVKSFLYSMFYETYEHIRSGGTGKPVQLSRSKKAMSAFGYAAEQVETLWQQLVEFGTVSSLKANYEIVPEDGDIDETPITMDEIREESQNIYTNSYLDTDVYKDVDSAIGEYEQELTTMDIDFDEEYQEALERAKEVFYEKGKGTREEKWERARNILQRAVMRHKIKTRIKHRKGKGRKDLGSNE